MKKVSCNPDKERSRKEIVLCPEAIFNQSVESQVGIAMAGYSTARTMDYTKAEFVAFTDDECVLGEA